MKKGFWKKVVTVICVFASILVIGNSVSGWVNDKTNDTNEKTEISTETEE